MAPLIVADVVALPTILPRGLDSLDGLYDPVHLSR
jgi:hypothetical protein